jgi:hypothetical protein
MGFMLWPKAVKPMIVERERERERERESKIVVFMVTGLNKQVKSNV